MFALAIRYLSGRPGATPTSGRIESEWPPHPARVFSALATAHYETGADPLERRALEWLERQPPPELWTTEADARIFGAAVVPFNDVEAHRVLAKGGAGAALGVWPQGAWHHQEPSPSASPEPCIYLRWPNATLPDGAPAVLARLAAKVEYLGPSCAVSMYVCADAPSGSAWLPDDSGDVLLRVVTDGQLEALGRSFARSGTPGQRARLPSQVQRYRRTTARELGGDEGDQGVFQDMIMARLGPGPRLPLEVAHEVAKAYRAALLVQSPEQPAPRVLSGRKQDGDPSDVPHVAIVPIPHVGSDFADGHLVGVAAVLPRGLRDEERRLVLETVDRTRELRVKSLGTWGLEPIVAEAPTKMFRYETWCRPSRRWASVTPVVLDKFPKTRYGEEAEGIVARACTYVGLPVPADIVLTPVSLVAGVPAAYVFSGKRRAGGARRLHVHALLTFSKPVRGPVVLGAGRFQGLGFFRPLDGAR